MFIDPSLSEINFGIADWMTEDDMKKIEDYWDYRQRYRSQEATFFERAPHGESRSDVHQRAKQFVDSVYRDIQNGHCDHVIVTHQRIVSILAMAIMHYSFQQQDSEGSNPDSTVFIGNASIRVLQKNSGAGFVDYGIAYKGCGSEDYPTTLPDPLPKPPGNEYNELFDSINKQLPDALAQNPNLLGMIKKSKPGADGLNCQ